MGWIDVELTSEGMDQGKKAAELLDEYDIQKVYCSPLKRCVDMAQIYTAYNAKPIMQDRGLLPFNRGILTGTSSEAGKPALKLFLENPDVQIPYGESRLQAEQRIEGFFHGTLKDAESKTTAFFTHHSVIDMLNDICQGKRTPEPKNLVKPGGVVAVYVDGDGYRLEPILNADDSSATIS